jgi:hypothetical protein
MLAVQVKSSGMSALLDIPESQLSTAEVEKLTFAGAYAQ